MKEAVDLFISSEQKVYILYS